MPEALVEVDRELAVARQALQRLDARGSRPRVVAQVVEHLALEDEEAAGDDALGERRLLVELDDPAAVDPHLAVARGRVDAGDRGDPPLGPVEIEQGVDVDVAHRVAVGEAEGRGVEVALAPDTRRAPVPVSAPVSAQVTRQLSLPTSLWKRSGWPPSMAIVKSAVHLLVAQEVLLDLPTLVAEAEDEALEPVGVVDLHDVPEDRVLADLHHGLRPVLGLLAQAGALAAAEDDHRQVALRGPRHVAPSERPDGRPTADCTSSMSPDCTCQRSA